MPKESPPTHEAPALAAASLADFDDYAALLLAAGLPPDGLADCLETALVARDASGALRGAVALEIYSSAAFLRSLVVDARERGAGLGGALVAGALALARARDLTEVYLLTETAAHFFARRGFEPVERGRVPADVRSSIQFRAACPQSAAAMRLDLSADTLHPTTGERP